MKTIPLSNRDFGCQVNDDGYEFLSKFSWYAKKSRRGDVQVVTNIIACGGMTKCVKDIVGSKRMGQCCS